MLFVFNLWLTSAEITGFNLQYLYCNNRIHETVFAEKQTGKAIIYHR